MEIKTTGLAIKNLTKVFYGEKGDIPHTAVDNISLDIPKGEMVTLLGPSGCGKTTTLRMIAGFEHPTNGTISMGDADITTTPPDKRSASMVFQSYALFPHMTIEKNVGYGLEVQGWGKKEIEERVKEVLDLMHIMDTATRLPNQLSGGQQQRVALARAIIIEPKVLLFDEPLSNLDAKLRIYMRDELRKIQQRLGITSIYVTHDQTEAMAISDKVVIMNNGIIEQIGSPIEVYKSPVNQFVANFMGNANFIKAVVLKKNKDSVLVDLLGTKVDLSFNSIDKIGEIVDCMIRPESVQFGASEGIEAIVKERTYLGSTVEYVVTVKDISLSFVDSLPFGHRLFNIGEKVLLGLHFDDIRIFAHEKRR